MNADTIDKFNNYCADVMGYPHDYKNDEGDAYNPYYNLYQVAAVVQELVNLTGKYPECEVFGSGASTWKIWHNFVISTMPNSEDGDKPEGWDEYIKLHKEKLAVMENSDIFDLSDAELNAGFACTENKEVIKGCFVKERCWEVDTTPTLVNFAYGVDGHYCIKRYNQDKQCAEYFTQKNGWCSAGDVFDLGKVGKE